MAKDRINVYNITILDRQTINKFNFLAAVIVSLLAFLCLLSPKVYAQASLQPSGGTLQPQAGQTQPTTNDLNQTGAVQSNTGGQSFLNQSGLRPLGVVSDPKNTTPGTIASPSQTLKTDTPVGAEEGRSILPKFAIVSIIIVVVGVIFLWRGERKEEVHEPTFIEESIPGPKTEPVVKRVKKNNRSRKKRRKGRQR